MTELRVRNESHKDFNAQTRLDWLESINMHPDRFDAYLYRNTEELDQSQSAGLEESTGTGYEEVLFTNLDTDRQANIYQEPVIVSVVDTIDDSESFLMNWDGETQSSNTEDALCLRVGSHEVPKGSILEWKEATATGSRSVYWYVLRSAGYGTSNVGALHFCIPCRDLEVADLPSVEGAKSE